MAPLLGAGHILVLVLALICVGVASANPAGEVKSSPLFKSSLAQSIAKLEGKVQGDAVAANEDGDMPTGKRICPDLPLTEQATQCTYTCSGYWTCQSSTCYNTCASTCANTCVGDPGSCREYLFQGNVEWGGYFGNPPQFLHSNDWANLPEGWSVLWSYPGFVGVDYYLGGYGGNWTVGWGGAWEGVDIHSYSNGNSVRAVHQVYISDGWEQRMCSSISNWQDLLCPATNNIDLMTVIEN